MKTAPWSNITYHPWPFFCPCFPDFFTRFIIGNIFVYGNNDLIYSPSVVRLAVQLTCTVAVIVPLIIENWLRFTISPRNRGTHMLKHRQGWKMNVRVVMPQLACLGIGLFA